MLPVASHIDSLLFFFLVLANAQSYTAITSNATGPIVDLSYVRYVGYTNATAGIHYFRGIPFAQPPIGDLRWRSPRPIEAKNNFTGQTINASKIAPACYQSQPKSVYDPSSTAFSVTPQGQSEDCLVLDVLLPTNPISSSIPVMVQLHGGGYTQGNAESYPGDALVNSSNGQMVCHAGRTPFDRSPAKRVIDLRLNAIQTRYFWVPGRRRDCSGRCSEYRSARSKSGA